MSKHVPCPNPACSAVFSAESIRGSSRPACPRCGTSLSSGGAPSSTRRREGTGNRSASGRAGKPGDPPTPGTSRSSVGLEGGEPADVDYSPPPARERPLVPPKSAAKVIVTPAPPLPATPSENKPPAVDPAAPELALELAASPVIKRRSVRRRRRALAHGHDTCRAGLRGRCGSVGLLVALFNIDDARQTVGRSRSV